MDQRDSSNPLLTVNAKRFAYHNNNAMLYCVYCTKNDFDNLEQLHAHVQQMHAIVLREVIGIKTNKAFRYFYENIPVLLYFSLATLDN